jgi:DNA-directed RNA polymerase subunit H (RpoH/RPB5)
MLVLLNITIDAKTDDIKSILKEFDSKTVEVADTHGYNIYHEAILITSSKKVSFKKTLQERNVYADIIYQSRFADKTLQIDMVNYMDDKEDGTERNENLDDFDLDIDLDNDNEDEQSDDDNEGGDNKDDQSDNDQSDNEDDNVSVVSVDSDVSEDSDIEDDNDDDNDDTISHISTMSESSKVTEFSSTGNKRSRNQDTYANRSILFIQHFRYNSMVANILTNELQPIEVKVLTNSQAKKVLEDYNMTAYQCPRIFVSDPLAKRYGLIVGQMIKMKNISPTSVIDIKYRICVAG